MVTAMPDVKIRLYEKGDEHQIVRLFKTVYGKDLTVEQWQWKYLGQGNLRVLSAVSVNERDEIVAHYGAVPVRMRFRGSTIIACQLVDAMVLKGYRAGDLGLSKKQGLFYKLGNLLYETYTTFFYAFPGIVYYSWGRKAGHIEESIEVTEYRTKCKDRGKMNTLLYSLNPLAWTDERIDDLWSEVRNSLGWTVERDREFLKWRYRENPFYTHSLYGLQSIFSDSLLGLVVIREEGDDIMVMDLVFKDEKLETLLLKTANSFSGKGKNMLRIWIAERYGKRLVKSGFEPFNTGTWIPNFIHVKVADSKEIKDNLNYTMGDTDFL
jgi:hypothetical protein